MASALATDEDETEDEFAQPPESGLVSELAEELRRSDVGSESPGAVLANVEPESTAQELALVSMDAGQALARPLR